MAITIKKPNVVRSTMGATPAPTVAKPTIQVGQQLAQGQMVPPTGVQVGTTPTPTPVAQPSAPQATTAPTASLTNKDMMRQSLLDMFPEEHKLEKKLVLGIFGVTTSGKTTTAQMLAESIILAENIGKGKRWATLDDAKKECGVNLEGNIARIPAELAAQVGIIDTEHGRAKQSSNLVMQIKGYGTYQTGEAYIRMAPDPKFITVDAFTLLKEDMKERGIRVVIIDSATHLWDNMKQIVYKQQQTQKDQYGAWSAITPDNKKMADQLLADKDIHVITCMRAKPESVRVLENGKEKIKIVGTKADIRETTSYEFNVMIQLEYETHKAQIMKDNTNLLLSGAPLNPNDGIALVGWSNDTLNHDQRFDYVYTRLLDRFGKAKIDDVVMRFCHMYKFKSFADITGINKIELAHALVEELVNDHILGADDPEIVLLESPEITMAKTITEQAKIIAMQNEQKEQYMAAPAPQPVPTIKVTTKKPTAGSMVSTAAKAPVKKVTVKKGSAK